MEVLIGPVLGLGGMVLAFIFAGPIREAAARHRTRRIARGAPVSFAARVSVDNGRLRRARLSRGGDRLCVRTWRGGFQIPVRPGVAVTRHQEDSSDPVGDWLLERHTDPGGRVVDVGTRLEDRRALAALRSAPSARRPRISGRSGRSVAVAGLLLLGAVCLTGLYAASYDATATVRDVNDDASSCLVEWQHGSRSRLTHVDCGSDDAAGVGLTLPIVAQPEPFADQAFSGERSEIFEIDAVVLAGLLLILGAGVWRARGPRHPVLLSPVLVDRAASGDPALPSMGSSVAADAGVIALARYISTLEGWPRGWDAINATAVSPRRDLVGAFTRTGWWTPVFFLVAMTGDQVLLGCAERYTDELDDDVCAYLRSRIEECA